jgi:hypothetical protein
MLFVPKYKQHIFSNINKNVGFSRQWQEHIFNICRASGCGRILLMSAEAGGE